VGKAQRAHHGDRVFRLREKRLHYRSCGSYRAVSKISDSCELGNSIHPFFFRVIFGNLFCCVQILRANLKLGVRNLDTDTVTFVVKGPRAFNPDISIGANFDPIATVAVSDDVFDNNGHMITPK
jgi:hypothetical protein